MAKTVVIDCAFDKKVAQKLFEYLENEGHDEVRIEDGSKVALSVDRKSLKKCKKDLDEFIEKYDEGYKVTRTDGDTYLLAKKANIEEFGLSRCEICGYVAFEEELFAHRRAHGI